MTKINLPPEQHQMLTLALQKAELTLQCTKHHDHWSLLRRQSLLAYSRWERTKQQLDLVDRELAALDGRTTVCKPKIKQGSRTGRQVTAHQRAEQAALAKLKAAMAQLPEDLRNAILAKYEAQI